MCERLITKSHSVSSVQGNSNNKPLSVVLTLTQGAKGSVRNALGPQEEFRGGVGGATLGSILLLQSEALRCFLRN